MTILLPFLSQSCMPLLCLPVYFSFLYKAYLINVSSFASVPSPLVILATFRCIIPNLSMPCLKHALQSSGPTPAVPKQKQIIILYYDVIQTIGSEEPSFAFCMKSELDSYYFSLATWNSAIKEYPNNYVSAIRHNIFMRRSSVLDCHIIGLLQRKQNIEMD